VFESDLWSPVPRRCTRTVSRHGDRMPSRLPDGDEW